MRLKSTQRSGTLHVKRSNRNDGIGAQIWKYNRQFRQSRQWPVYAEYKIEVDAESGESYVAACTSMVEPVADETDEHGQRVKSYRGRDPMQDATPYLPLRGSK